MNIERVEGKTATDEQIAAISGLYNIVFGEFYPDDPPMSPAELAAEYRSEPASVLRHLWIAREGSRAVAVSRIWRDAVDNVHLAWMSVWVAPDHRRRGIGSELAQLAISAAQDEGRTQLFASTGDDTTYGEFAEKMGFERSRQRGRDNLLQNHENRLQIASVDRSLLTSWVDRAKERAADYELLFWDGPTSKELLGDFARVVNVMNTAPMAEGEQDWDFTPDKVTEWETRQADNGYIFWTYAARHLPSAELAGYTRIYPNPWRPSLAYQDDTGVDPRHRNKGLGRWLKAAMLEKLIEVRPGTATIITGNAASNEAMLSINNALGFRPHLTWNSWQRGI